MCGLAGFIGTNNLSEKELSNLCNNLARQAMSRGTDATGIAYVQDGLLQIHKESRPADEVNFAIPRGTEVVMIHTRLGTGGSSDCNYNNHPFFEKTLNGNRFALAHNGVVHNFSEIQKEYNLPKTEIKTDSYVAVQLLNQEAEISFETVGRMAEKIQGPFVFTILEENNNVWIVKGDNPLCLLKFPHKNDIIIYGSTEEIVFSALVGTPLFEEVIKAAQGEKDRIEFMNIEAGETLLLSPSGAVERGKFNYIPYIRKTQTSRHWSIFGDDYPYINRRVNNDKNEEEHIAILKTVGHVHGYSAQDIDELILAGFSASEIESELFDNDYE